METNISEAMGREILKRLNEIQDALMTRETLKEQPLKPPIWLDIPAFKKITGLGDTAARAYFKNRELIRRKILVKITESGKMGGWLIDYERWVKWANDNAKETLNI
jgi:hypothetical protein